MKHLYAKRLKHCRWCGKGYYATKPFDRDGFGNKAHKQAHYRAYKKYVTAKSLAAGKRYPRPVTRKTPSTPSASQGKKRKKRSQK